MAIHPWLCVTQLNDLDLVVGRYLALVVVLLLVLLLLYLLEYLFVDCHVSEAAITEVHHKGQLNLRTHRERVSVIRYNGEKLFTRGSVIPKTQLTAKI